MSGYSPDGQSRELKPLQESESDRWLESDSAFDSASPPATASGGKITFAFGDLPCFGE